MIGRRPLLLALAVLNLAVPAAAATNWANAVSATPAGGILIGNPAAKVKIIEFASYSCSHCKTFHEAGLPALKAKYIAGGKVSIEQRSFVRNGPDFSASLLVGCLPTAQRVKMADALFAEQAKWTQPFIDIAASDAQAVMKLPPEQQPARMAELSGLDGWAAKRGLPLAKGRVCLVDKAAQEQLLATRSEAVDKYKLEGTPLFVINGATVIGVYDWASLEPAVKAAM